MLYLQGLKGRNMVLHAGVAQLVERDLAKVEVTGSSPATRSIKSVESKELTERVNSFFYLPAGFCAADIRCLG